MTHKLYIGVGLTSIISCFLIKKIYKNSYYHIEIPLKRNLNLLPKIQHYVKEHSYGGKKTILENGKRVVKTGKMITLKPVFAIFDINISKKINDDINLNEDKISIYLFSFKYNYLTFINYLNEINYQDNVIKVFNLTTDSETFHWHFCKYIERYQQPDYYPEFVIDTITNEMDTFIRNKEKYITKGRNYKKTFLFYGPTGSGKTSMVKYLAIKYARNIYLMSPEDFFNGSGHIYSALKACEGGIILMEDIDKFFKALFEKEEYANISKLLTVLDGFYTPENTIIIMTADYTGNLPDSFIRDGRLDVAVKFPYINDKSMDVISKVCHNYFIDKTKIKIKGDITTSYLIKNIENANDNDIDIIIEDSKNNTDLIDDYVSKASFSDLSS